MGLALRRIHGLGAPLHHVADAVELGGLAPVPEGPELHGFARGGAAHQAPGHHGEGAAGAGEAGVLGEGTELNGALPCPLDFVDGVGEFGVLDEGLVGRIEQDQGPMGAGVVHPLLQLGLAGHGAGGVVGEAEVDQVHRFGGDLGGEAVIGRDRQVGEAAVAAGVIGFASAAGHHVAVYVHRIDRIGHGDAVALAQDVEDVAAVALGAVGDEDLLGRDGAAAGLEVVGGDGFAQPQIALFGPVAVEALAGAHGIDGGLHGGAAGLGQGLGDIADAEANDRCLGVGLTKSLHPPGDFGEQVARFELEVVAVDLDHQGGGAIRWVLMAGLSYGERPRR